MTKVLSVNFVKNQVQIRYVGKCKVYQQSCFGLSGSVQEDKSTYSKPTEILSWLCSDLSRRTKVLIANQRKYVYFLAIIPFHCLLAHLYIFIKSFVVLSTCIFFYIKSAFLLSKFIILIKAFVLLNKFISFIKSLVLLHKFIISYKIIGFRIYRFL